MTADVPNSRTLFGGQLGWHSADWTASDDRVRGGHSKSNLLCGDAQALFYGHLDIKTLGGAGFASQRTTGELSWDLSSYHGIELALNEAETDEKQYTFIVKDTVLPNDPDTGREQATISWEYDFRLPKSAHGVGQGNNRTTIFIPWQSFTATYRGKEKKDAGNLDVSNIKRLSIMMRSFFGTQEGDFKLGLLSIKASCHTPAPVSPSAGDDEGMSWSSSTLRKTDRVAPEPKHTMWHWLLGKCGKL